MSVVTKKPKRSPTPLLEAFLRSRAVGRRTEPLFAAHHKPFDRLALLPGNPEQGRGTGLFQPLLDGRSVVLGAMPASAPADTPVQSSLLRAVEIVGKYRGEFGFAAPQIAAYRFIQGRARSGESVSRNWYPPPPYLLPP